jgi:single-strand DNA-binding protein
MPNKLTVDLTGHAGRDAELKYTENGQALMSVSVAVNSWRRKDDPPTWFNVTLWGKRAEALAQYIQKGDVVNVWGELDIRPYTSNSGDPGISYDVNAEGLTPLGRRQDREADSGPPPAEDLSDIPF